MMANYRVQIANRTYDVSIQDDTLEVNGDLVAYNMDSLDGKGLHVLRRPNRNVEAHVEPTLGGSYEIQIEGNTLNAEVALGFRSDPKSQSAYTSRVLSPMPGLIIDIMVAVGDTVKKGETLIIQEAMKMQMKLRSPQQGIISAIYASPGSQVEKGTPLISLEPWA